MTTKLRNRNIGDAGEYYIAYRLSMMGISVALTTSGTSAVDIIATFDGTKSISIQIKASRLGLERKQWPVSKQPFPSPDLFFIFCSFPDKEDALDPPRIYIVPSSDVAADGKWRGNTKMYTIKKDKVDDYLNNWDVILSALNIEP